MIRRGFMTRVPPNDNAARGVEVALQVQAVQQEQRRQAGSDVVIADDRRLILRSPNGHFWALTVGDTGTLAATDLGTEPPA